jgi:hypothetical protein
LIEISQQNLEQFQTNVHCSFAANSLGRKRRLKQGEKLICRRKIMSNKQEERQSQQDGQNVCIEEESQNAAR